MPDIVPKVNYLPQITPIESTSLSLYRHYTKPEKRTRQKAKPQ